MGCGKFTYCWESERYKRLDSKGIPYESSLLEDKLALEFFPSRQGPAIKGMMASTLPLHVEQDLVICMKCLMWPVEASEWVTRKRISGWPSEELVTKIVAQGCHVVPIAHWECPNDIHQWRLSFSVAEICLLKSWSPVQQIIYHVLRVFNKVFDNIATKDLLGNSANKMICNYHLKTLMLWACENKSTEWWSSQSVVLTCCNMLKYLCKWLRQGTCPNYFVKSCNLFRGNFSNETITDTLHILIHYSDSTNMAVWLKTNYVDVAVEQFFDPCGNVPLYNYNLPRQATVPAAQEYTTSFTELLIPLYERGRRQLRGSFQRGAMSILHTFLHGFTQIQCATAMNYFTLIEQLRIVDERFVIYFKACSYFRIISLMLDDTHATFTYILSILDALLLRENITPTKIPSLWSTEIHSSIAYFRKAEAYIILNLESLELRRLKNDLLMYYKVLHNCVDLDKSDFFNFAQNDYNTRGHNLKLKKFSFSNNCLENTFSNRCINCWNWLPNDVVNCSSISSFRAKLKIIDFSDFLKGRALVDV